MAEDNATLNRSLVVRMSEAEMDRIAMLQKWLEERYEEKLGKGIRVTQRMVILEALDSLEKRKNELGRPR